MFVPTISFNLFLSLPGPPKIFVYAPSPNSPPLKQSSPTLSPTARSPAVGSPSTQSPVGSPLAAQQHPHSRPSSPPKKSSPNLRSYADLVVGPGPFHLLFVGDRSGEKGEGEQKLTRINSVRSHFLWRFSLLGDLLLVYFPRVASPLCRLADDNAHHHTKQGRTILSSRCRRRQVAPVVSVVVWVYPPTIAPTPPAQPHLPLRVALAPPL